MAIELHHMHPGHDDEVTQLKQRIAELETMNHDLVERVTELKSFIVLYDGKFIRAYKESDADKVIAELKARIAELEEERRWRKFPDEKPTKDIKFLVINKKGFLQCSYYSPILHEFQIPVTHWMPLPSAPKEGR